mgnify:CR=1 FL=1
MGQDQQFNNLKAILLKEEITKREQLRQQFEQLRLKIQEQEESLSPHIQAMIDDEIQHLKVAFPKEFGIVITETIKTRIEESKEEMVTAFYPIVGQLIKKYIQKEIELLTEKVDQKVSTGTSWEFWKQQLKNILLGVKNGDQVLTSTLAAKIEAVFVLEEKTGILLGSITHKEIVDKDMVGAMLIAIKNFVEDAFKREKENLEWIEYETFKININTQKTFNIALIISGAPNQNFKQKINNQILEFSKEYHKTPNKIESTINQLLKNYFEEI